MDGQHALHCLNAVRRYAYREHYYPDFQQTGGGGSDTDADQTATTNRKLKSPLPPIHQAHLSHCLHILLQTLTCNPSTDFITHNWMKTQHYPFPDFAIHRQCRSHHALLEWQEENRLSEEQWVEMAARGPAEGETVLELPPLMGEWVESRQARAVGGDQAHG